MTAATTTLASVSPARFAPEPLRSVEGTPCLSAPDAMGAATSRLRDAIVEFSPLICLMVPRNAESSLTQFRAEPQKDARRDKPQQRA
jgi:hypothetical protein